MEFSSFNVYEHTILHNSYSIYSYKQHFNLEFILFYTLGDIFTTLYPLYV